MNGLLSFLCKDKEEKCKNKPYNDKDKRMSKGWEESGLFAEGKLGMDRIP